MLVNLVQGGGNPVFPSEIVYCLAGLRQPAIVIVIDNDPPVRSHARIESIEVVNSVGKRPLQAVPREIVAVARWSRFGASVSFFGDPAYRMASIWRFRSLTA